MGTGPEDHDANDDNGDGNEGDNNGDDDDDDGDDDDDSDADHNDCDADDDAVFSLPTSMTPLLGSTYCTWSGSVLAIPDHDYDGGNNDDDGEGEMLSRNRYGLCSSQALACTVSGMSIVSC